MTKVSVIIPNYNHARYLELRINTVLNQTYQDFDVLIMDDCSADNSKEIIESYRSHPKVKILYNTENSGNVFKQWQKGVNNTKGEYIWIAESDDYSDPLFLENLMNLLEKNKEVNIAFCANKIVDENNKELREVRRPDLSKDRKITEHAYLINGNLECQTNFISNNIIVNVSSCVIRRNKFVHIDKSLSYKLCGDWLFYINIALNSNLIYLDRPLNYYRESNSSVRNASVRSAIHLKEQLSIFFYLNSIFSFNNKIRRNYVKEFSMIFIYYLFSGKISLAKGSILKITTALHKIYSFAFIYIIKSSISLSFILFRKNGEVTI